MKDYMVTHCYSNQYRRFLYGSKLTYVFYRDPELKLYVSDNKEVEELFEKEKFKKINMNNVLLFANTLLCENGIIPIHFKGITLAKLTYSEPYARLFGDIDFVVKKEEYEKALDILVRHGFEKLSQYDSHHIALIKDGIEMEVHTSFFPSQK